MISKSNIKIDNSKNGKGFWALAFVFITLAAKAQYIPERGENIHFTLGHSMLLNAPAELKNEWRSMSWQLQIVHESFIKRKSHFSVAYGLGYTGSFWHTNLDIQTFPGSQANVFSFLPADSSYTGNKFSGQYIDVPLELRYRSNSNKKGQYYRLYIGGFFGVRVGSYSQLKAANYKVRQFDIEEMNRWHYGVFLRTGWYVYNLYVQYNLNPVFGLNPASSPQTLNKMTNLTVGLSISL